MQIEKYKKNGFEKFKSPVFKTPSKNRNKCTTNFIVLKQNQSIHSKKKQSHPFSKNNKIQFVNSTGIGDYCQNHPEKQSHFIIQIQGQLQNFCYECAKRLKDQGFDVMQKQKQLRKMPKPMNRQQQVKQLVEKLEVMMNDAMKSKTQFDSRKKGIINHYKNELHTIDIYYKKIVKFIQQLKQEAVCAFDEQMKKCIQQIQIYYKECLEYEAQIGNMYEDIQNNIEDILKVSQNKYRIVIDQYQQRCKFFAIKFQEFISQPKEVYACQPITQDLIQKFADDFLNYYEVKVLKTNLRQSNGKSRIRRNESNKGSKLCYANYLCKQNMQKQNCWNQYNQEQQFVKTNYCAPSPEFSKN